MGSNPAGCAIYARPWKQFRGLFVFAAQSRWCPFTGLPAWRSPTKADHLTWHTGRRLGHPWTAMLRWLRRPAVPLTMADPSHRAFGQETL